MPRRPKFDHPLRHLRETIGYTQERFARLLGVSTPTIQSVELWRMAMSEDLALKVRQQTGCVPFRTGTSKSKRSTALRFRSFDTGEVYTAKDFKQHQDNMQNFAEQEFEHHVNAAANCINLLIRAAARRGGGYVLTICNDFERFVMEAHDRYKLKSQVIALVKEQKVPYVGGGTALEEIENFEMAPLSTAYSFPLSSKTEGGSE